MNPRTWNSTLPRLDAALRAISSPAGVVDWGDVKVAHLDTGYTEHPAFGDWSKGKVPLLVNEGVNFLEPGKPPLDPLKGTGLIRTPGHGTRTSSVLCAPAQTITVDGVKSSFSGMAPGIPVVPYRVVEDVVLEPQMFNRGIWVNLAAAVNHAVEVRHCNLISISLGGPVFPGPELGAAIDRAYEAGVMVIAAAGQYTDSVTYPGKFDRAIGVGGLKSSESWIRIYNHYNAGRDRVDVWGPADPIFRADSTLTNSKGKAVKTPIYGWGYGDGTSYATVHVVAAAAIWRKKQAKALQNYHGWQQIEAFRVALAQAYGTLPHENSPVPRDRAADYTTGTLDAYRLLYATLPKPEQLTKNERLAEKEQN